MSISRPTLAPSLAEQGFAGFHRLVAVYCLVLGLLYWIRLVGVYPGDLWRFDLMPVHWQVASVTLAALFPFAAVGLWMLASWGAVVWFICMIIEAFMYFWRADLFGPRPLLVAAHVALAATFLGLYVLTRRNRPTL